jgi:hypothetical protein
MVVNIAQDNFWNQIRDRLTIGNSVSDFRRGDLKMPTDDREAFW